MIPLYKTYMPENLPELNNILRSNELSYGKWGQRFEEKLREYFENPNIAVVNSYNSAMLVTLTTLGLRVEDEVIASPVSCLASNQPFVTLGIKVVWADIDPETGTLSPDDVEKKITNKTKAIFHNHHCGYPGYVDEINDIGKKFGLFVVDDAIEAFGSKYKGKLIGNTGADATVFSFHTVRLPNTIDGGAFSFKDNGLFEKAKRIRDYGIRRELFRDEYGEISKKCDISEPGYGATLNEVNSYIGYQQMEKIDNLLAQQKKNAIAWEVKISSEYPKIRVLRKTFQSPNFWIFGVLTPTKFETLIHFREKGYYASSVHLPNNYYSIFGQHTNLPGVNEFHKKFIALPCGWWFLL